jgi:hypothetical protein
MLRTRTAAAPFGALAGVVMDAALAAGAMAQQPVPPTIDCSQTFDALKAAALALPGAERSEHAGFDMVTQELPDRWRIEYFFTTRWHPAYPAVALRTLRKQVTGVWTAESKACGYGDKAQFAGLVEDMKASDKQLTAASRAEVARKNAERSPLSAGP